MDDTTIAGDVTSDCGSSTSGSGSKSNTSASSSSFTISCVSGMASPLDDETIASRLCC